MYKVLKSNRENENIGKKSKVFQLGKNCKNCKFSNFWGGYFGKVQFEHRKNSNFSNFGGGISEKSNLNIGKILSFPIWGGYFGKVKFEHRKNSKFSNFGDGGGGYFGKVKFEQRKNSKFLNFWGGRGVFWKSNLNRGKILIQFWGWGI